MNINSNKPPEGRAPNRSAQSAGSVQKPGSAEQKEKTAQAKNAAPADRVDISGRSKEIADITAAIDQLPETRDGKVQEIRQSVEAGTYTVDAHKVADAIIKSI